MLNRRFFVAAALAAGALPVLAHHGWSSFDQAKPLYLAGTVKSVRWQNPHAELVLTVAPKLALPADLAARTAPPQSQTVDAAAIFKQVALPAQPAGDWEIELAPLSRMAAWNAPELKPGERIEIIGYALSGASGDRRVIRVEYLIAGGKMYGLRSSPQ
jgi:hypothetical protein